MPTPSSSNPHHPPASSPSSTLASSSRQGHGVCPEDAPRFSEAQDSSDGRWLMRASRDETPADEQPAGLVGSSPSAHHRDRQQADQVRRNHLHHNHNPAGSRGSIASAANSDDEIDGLRPGNLSGAIESRSTDATQRTRSSEAAETDETNASPETSADATDVDMSPAPQSDGTPSAPGGDDGDHNRDRLLGGRDTTEGPKLMDIDEGPGAAETTTGSGGGTENQQQHEQQERVGAENATGSRGAGSEPVTTLQRRTDGPSSTTTTAATTTTTTTTRHVARIGDSLSPASAAEDSKDEHSQQLGLMGDWFRSPGVHTAGYEYSNLRVIPTTPSSFLRPGSKFYGTQQSERQVYEVQVEIKHVDLRESFLCGFLRIQGLTEDHPTLTTYFEGEIIGTKYGFITKHDTWGATDKIDLNHWAKFTAFRAYQKQARKGPVYIRDLAQKEHIFMRWKEHFLVPDHRVRTINGASFEGFYYICFNQLRGEVSGIYFHAKSEKFQQLELKHVEDRGCFNAMEFR